MKLNSHQSDTAQSQQQNLAWSIAPYIKTSQQRFQAATWVHLLELPSPFSHDEALLLCQNSEDEWVAWIPDHGEAVLHSRQFCYC
jgi:hypothetical protein